MFTGIVQDLGVIREIKPDGDSKILFIESALEARHFVKGNSILTDGVCLTVENYDENSRIFQTTLIPETLGRSHFSQVQVDQRVNLEPSLTMDSFLAGHLAMGHVDTMAEVVQQAPALRVRLPLKYARFFPEKGTIAINGVSLTIVSTQRLTDFAETEVALIPETLRMTNLGDLNLGDLVNIEIDAVARYLDSLIQK